MSSLLGSKAKSWVPELLSICWTTKITYAALCPALCATVFPSTYPLQAPTCLYVMVTIPDESGVHPARKSPDTATRRRIVRSDFRNMTFSFIEEKKVNGC